MRTIILHCHTINNSSPCLFPQDFIRDEYHRVYFLEVVFERTNLEHESSVPLVNHCCVLPILYLNLLRDFAAIESQFD